MSYSWKKDEESPYRLSLIFLINIDKEVEVKLSDELNDFGWFNLEEIEKWDTIGKDSPTGTFQQVNAANEIDR